jgi:hypothetical protein
MVMYLSICLFMARSVLAIISFSIHVHVLHAHALLFHVLHVHVRHVHVLHAHVLHVHIFAVVMVLEDFSLHVFQYYNNCFLSLTTTGCALPAAAVTDTTKRTVSKIVRIFFTLLSDCFNIYFTPLWLKLVIFRFVNFVFANYSSYKKLVV